MKTILLLVLLMVNGAICFVFHAMPANLRRLSQHSKQMTTTTLSAQSSHESNKEPRTYSSYVVYKGRAAVAIKLIPPSYSSLSPTSRTVDREGGLLFEFAPTGSQPREYDWSRKTTFLLDAGECGELLTVSRDSKASPEFVHDPNMGGEKSGQITKKLKLQPTPDGKGYFLSLTVSDKSLQAPISYSLPVAHGEMEVIRQIMSYAIPYFLGFHEVWSNPGLGESPGEYVPPPPPVAPIWKKITPDQ